MFLMSEHKSSKSYSIFDKNEGKHGEWYYFTVLRFKHGAVHVETDSSMYDVDPKYFRRYHTSEIDITDADLVMIAWGELSRGNQ